MQSTSFINVPLRNVWNDEGSGWERDIAVYSIADDNLETEKSGCFLAFGNHNFGAYINKDLSWAIRKDVTYEVKPEDISPGN